MIVAACLLVTLIAVAESSPANASASFSFFYSNLSPYGSWVVSSSYGQVWRPSVYTAGWNPYYDGHWVYTDVGWTWVSDYPWGGVCYHYGTWDFEPALGWVWVPGYVWAPAWVEFRTGPDYVGWAPVPPRFSFGVSFGLGGMDPGRFVFVSTGNFLAPTIRFHTVPLAQTRLVFQHTSNVRNLRIENGIVVNRGLETWDVEKASGRKVRMTPIERVGHVGPMASFSRNEMRVDPQRLQHGVRATEPAPAGKSNPHGRGGEEHSSALHTSASQHQASLAPSHARGSSGSHHQASYAPSHARASSGSQHQASLASSHARASSGAPQHPHGSSGKKHPEKNSPKHG
jgi:hypothetical protein